MKAEGAREGAGWVGMQEGESPEGSELWAPICSWEPRDMLVAPNASAFLREPARIKFLFLATTRILIHSDTEAS